MKTAYQLSTCTMRRRRNGYADASNEKDFQFGTLAEAQAAMDEFAKNNPRSEVSREGSVTICYHQDAVIYSYEFEDSELLEDFLAGCAVPLKKEHQIAQWNNCAKDF